LECHLCHFDTSEDFSTPGRPAPAPRQFLQTFHATRRHPDSVTIDKWPLSESNTSGVSQGKTQIATERGTESGTLGAQIDAELAQVIAAWPGLPADIRTQILTLANGAKG
jgi:hypothetical protein